MDTSNGDGYAYNFDKRLDRINDTITSLIDSIVVMRDFMLETHKLQTLRHQQTMDEIHELLELQKEHRIDIMALFQSRKND